MEDTKDTADSTATKMNEDSRQGMDSPSEMSSSGISSQRDSPNGIGEQSVKNEDDDEAYQAKLQQGLLTFTSEDTESSDRDNRPGEHKIDDEHGDSGESGGAMSSSGSKDSNLSSLAEEQLKKPLPEVLNDVAKFAYSSLVAVCLPNLFENEWNKQWNLKTVKSLSKYLKLPKQSEETLSIMVSDPNHHDLTNADVFTEVLLEEPSLIKPEIIPVDIITQALHDGTYDARMRVLVKEISRRLKVSWKTIRTYEKGIIDVYEQEEHQLTEEERRERDKKAKLRKAKRYVMIGAATIAGGAIIGLTGGLAAPLIATAGVALLGPGVGFFGTVAGAAIIGSILGGAGAGLSGYKMKKRVGEVEEFEFSALTEGRDLHVTVTVSGWLKKNRLDNFTAPWRCVATCSEIYCLKWESKYLIELGEAMEYILDTVMTMAAKEALKYTVLSGLLAAIALPAAAYAAISNSIDNPWSNATSRASEAGKQLAEVLLSRQQGKRPVTLIGFSMGARVIFFCLKELSQRKGCEGLVQDVYLLGAPVSSSVQQWKPFSRVVAGHIVNGFCRGDWLLQFVYRTASMQVNDIAGLEPIRWDNRRMVNVDLTEVVTGHLDYSDKISTILDFVGLETKQRPTSGDLSDLTNLKTKDTAMKAKEDDPSSVKFDASDLLLPKSASGMNLALAKLRGTKDPPSEEDNEEKTKPKTLAENVSHSRSIDKIAPGSGAPSAAADTSERSRTDDISPSREKLSADRVTVGAEGGESREKLSADRVTVGAEGGESREKLSADRVIVGAEGGESLERLGDVGRSVDEQEDVLKSKGGSVTSREGIEMGEDPLSALS